MTLLPNLLSPEELAAAEAELEARVNAMAEVLERRGRLAPEAGAKGIPYETNDGGERGPTRGAALRDDEDDGLPMYAWKRRRELWWKI